MSDQSIEQIRSELLTGAAGLARAARRLIRWRAVMIWLTVWLAALLILLVVDMLFRREELGLRILFLTIWLATAGYAAVRLLWPAWQFSPSSLEITQWIERGRPELQEQLSTAVQLASLSTSEGRYGSQGFRDSALRNWAKAKIQLDWQQFIDRGAVRRSGMMLAAVGVSLMLLALCWPHESRLALQRLTMPWARQHWPRTDQLRLQNPPHVIATGSELQLEVVDQKPPLPEKVELVIRSADRLDDRLTFIPTTQVGGLAVGNLPAVEQSIEVRAVGGDDDTMAWHRIDVVQPPELETYHFTIRPPNYSSRAASELVGRRIQVLAGSQVTFTGKFSEPVTSVAVQLIDSASDRSAEVEPIAAARPPARPEVRLAGDRRTVHITDEQGEPLNLRETMRWKLLIETVSGLRVLQPELWSVEVTEDAPPVVTMKPAELAELTWDAKVQLVGQAADDLGLAEVTAYLQLDAAENMQPRKLLLWQFDQQQAGDQYAPSELSIDAVWEMSSELPLTAGQRLSLWLEARDTLGQIGKSQVQAFEIRDSNDLLASLRERQNRILERVRELVDSQRANEQTTTKTAELLRLEQRVKSERADSLQGAAQIQRAIGKQLNHATDSIAAELKKLQLLLHQNRLGGSELASEINHLVSEVQQLSEQYVEPSIVAAESASRQTVEAVARNAALDEALEESLSTAASSQTTALRAMEALMDRLARNESLQQVQRELTQIMNQQNSLRRDTDQLQLQRLSQPDDEQLRERRTGLAADQQGLARRLEELVQRARELRDRASEDQQALKQQLGQAIQLLTEQQASSQMRRSTEEVRAEKFSAASMTQRRVAEVLSNALRQLAGESRGPLGSQLQNRAENLRQAGLALSELAHEQQQLARQMQAEDAARSQRQLTESQAELQQKTQVQAELAQQRGEALLAVEIEEATQLQDTARLSSESGDFQPAAGAAVSAAEQLARAADKLATRAENLERQIKQQQMFQLAPAITALFQQQQSVADEFRALAEDQVANGQEEETSRTAIGQTASRQEAVRQLLRDVRQQTDKLPTFDWTLNMAEQAMGRAVAAAERYRLEPEAKQAASEALRLLELAAEAIQTSPTEPSLGAGQTGDAADGTESERQSPGSARPLPALASLKLLRSLQQEVNRQTLQVEGTASPTNRGQKLTELAAMQKTLGELAEALLNEVSSTEPSIPPEMRERR